MSRRGRERISALAWMHAKEVSRSAEDWMDYLDMSARLYRYPFRDSFLIHAQRPDATACASFDAWNDSMNRRINRGAKGIALFDDGSYSGIRYVFDVADTHPARGGQEIALWTVDADIRERVFSRIAEAHGIDADREPEEVLREIARAESGKITDRALSAVMRQRGGTALAEMDGEELRPILQKLLTGSVLYSLCARCGMAAFTDKAELEAIASFDDLRTLSILGSATSRIVEPVLREISRAVAECRRQELDQGNAKRAEGRRADAAVKEKADEKRNRQQNGQDGGIQEREVRVAAGVLPERETAGAVRGPSADGSAGRTPVDDGNAGRETGQRADAGAGGPFPAAGQEHGRAAMDGAHERAAADGGGERDGRDSVPLADGQEGAAEDEKGIPHGAAGTESTADDAVSVHEEAAALLIAFYGSLAEGPDEIIFSYEERTAFEMEIPENVFTVASWLKDVEYLADLTERIEAAAEYFTEEASIVTGGYLPSAVASELRELSGNPGKEKDGKANTEDMAGSRTAEENGAVARAGHPLQERVNFRITDERTGSGSIKEKCRANIEAIRLLKRIEEEKRNAAPSEQEILSRYAGWGGIPQAFDRHNADWKQEYGELKALLTADEYQSARASCVTAFYTPPAVAEAIYGGLKNLGFTQGNILEPGCGTGNFMGMLPQEMSASKMFGVETDSISGRIARQLYQRNTIEIKGFQDTDYPESFFDAAVGNVPFADYGVADPKYDRHHFLIHDYFNAKSLDLVRPGGVVAVVTSSGTMDKKDGSFRRHIAGKADLLGAVRLPNTAFLRSANTNVVTDILFLQKRDRAALDMPEWAGLATTEDGFTVNAYFAEHPEMVLGSFREDISQYGRKIVTVDPDRDRDLRKMLQGAVSHIRGRIPDPPRMEEDARDGSVIPAVPGVANFSFTAADGGIYYRENSRMRRMELPKTTGERVRGMIRIRDMVRELLAAQLSDADDAEISMLQLRLNSEYDAFTKRYGLLSATANARAFSADSGYYLLASLEHLDAEGGLERKADIFTKRTIKRAQAVTSVETADEALAVSISEKAGVDLPFMARLSGKSEEELVRDLAGVIFKNPLTGNYENADEYLSGYVKEKLALAESLVESDPSLAVNVEYLKSAQPRPLEASEIGIRLGAAWVKPEYITQFMAETFRTPERLVGKTTGVLYNKRTGEWTVTGKSADRGNVYAEQTYGTDRIDGYRLLQITLNLKDAAVYDEVEDADGSKRRVKNAKETMLAQQKQELLKERFKEWVFKDMERREDLCATYNERFNNYRPRQYSGAHIRFAGMNPEIALMEHQRNAIAHALYGGNTLFAHCVGAGKTFEMVAAAMESKRLGLCEKSLFVVPNHLTEQWGAEFLRLYPAANILVATKRDFEPASRKTFCSRIATGGYDAVIIGQSQFERIPLSPERQERSIRMEIEELELAIEDAEGDEARYAVKQFEKMKAKLEMKLARLFDAKKDDAVTFEELGVDRLFIDESHFYKNLFLYTKMSNIAGISTTNAKKSADLFAKCRYMDEITGGKGVVFATGTPVSNSMVELYSIMRYLMFDALGRAGLGQFDAWASTFGETVTAVELAPEGTGYRTKTRFAKFYNLPELMALFKECADIQTADMLPLPTPEAEYINIAAKPSGAQKEYVASLADRADDVRAGKVRPDTDNMLKITNDGRKCALDMRLIDSACPDYAGSKVNLCADNVYGIWFSTRKRKSTQLIFSDLSTPKKDGAFNIYDDIREKLVRKGIPIEEIAFIHEYNTEKQKAALFFNVRMGKVRVLIGSTQKLGVGTNIQDRLIALHHLDCPWRPNDLQQRVGRILRQGNENTTVGIFSYVTEGTFDSYLWQTVENKQKFIAQIMTSRSPARACDDVDDTALSYAEVKALASGNPEIREKMELDVEVEKLKVLKKNYLDSRYRLEKKVEQEYPARIKEARQHAADCEKDLPSAKELTGRGKEHFSMEILGRAYDARTEAGSALIAACHALKGENGDTKIGHYGEFEVWGAYRFFGNDYAVSLKRNGIYKTELGSDPVGNIRRIHNALERIENDIAETKERIAAIESQSGMAKAELSKPFDREEELERKTERLNELNLRLNIGGKERRKEEAVGPQEEPEHGAASRPEEERGGKPSIIAELSQKRAQGKRRTQKQNYPRKDMAAAL